MIQSKVNCYIVAFLAGLLWCNTGCAKNIEETTESTAVVRNRANNASAPVKAKQRTQTIEAYLTEFSILLKTKDWDGLAELIDFPLIIQGELDDEGFVSVDRKMFVKYIGEFFQEEVYLTINDELVASTYRNLMIEPIDKPKIYHDIAELHGFQFLKKGQYWKLKKITTYVHIVENLCS